MSGWYLSILCNNFECVSAIAERERNLSIKEKLVEERMSR
jgi:hypothetical protein